MPLMSSKMKGILTICIQFNRMPCYKQHACCFPIYIIHCDFPWYCYIRGFVSCPWDKLMNPIVQICPSEIYMYILLTDAQHYLKSCHVVQLSLMSWILSYLVNELAQHLFAAWRWRSIQSTCNSISKQAKLQLLYKFCKSALNSDWVIVLMSSSSTCVSSTSIKIKANVVYIYGHPLQLPCSFLTFTYYHAYK